MALSGQQNLPPYPRYTPGSAAAASLIDPTTTAADQVTDIGDVTPNVSGEDSTPASSQHGNIQENTTESLVVTEQHTDQQQDVAGPDHTDERRGDAIDNVDHDAQQNQQDFKFPPPKTQHMEYPDLEEKMQSFWEESIKATENPTAYSSQILPVTRVKKIMKSDEAVKMTRQEAPQLMAKAAEAFIRDLTNRALLHAHNDGRVTIQRCDIATAAVHCDQFDFLIDIVPREEAIITPTENNIARTIDTGRHTTEGSQASFVLDSQQQHIIVTPNGRILSNSSMVAVHGVTGDQPVYYEGINTQQQAVQQPQQVQIVGAPPRLQHYYQGQLQTQQEQRPQQPHLQPHMGQQNWPRFAPTDAPSQTWNPPYQYTQAP